MPVRLAAPFTSWMTLPQKRKSPMLGGSFTENRWLDHQVSALKIFSNGCLIAIDATMTGTLTVTLSTGKTVLEIVKMAFTTRELPSQLTWSLLVIMLKLG